jgi:hypothetical protein
MHEMERTSLSCDLVGPDICDQIQKTLGENLKYACACAGMCVCMRMRGCIRVLVLTSAGSCPFGGPLV